MTRALRAAALAAALVSAAFPALAERKENESIKATDATETGDLSDLSELPAVIPFHSDRPVPAAYVVRKRYRIGLIASGGVLVGAFYAIPLIVAASTGFEDHSGYLAIPIAGPFLWGGARCDSSEGEEETSRCSGLTAALLGLPQIAGFALLGTGALVKKQELVRRDLAATSIVPLRFGTRGGGVAIVHAW